MSSFSAKPSRHIPGVLSNVQCTPEGQFASGMGSGWRLCTLRCEHGRVQKHVAALVRQVHRQVLVKAARAVERSFTDVETATRGVFDDRLTPAV